MIWTTKKPEFKEDCLLFTANKIRGEWEYHSWLIHNYNGYMAWCELDGEEYDDIADLTAEMYLTIPLLK